MAHFEAERKKRAVVIDDSEISSGRGGARRSAEALGDSRSERPLERPTGLEEESTPGEASDLPGTGATAPAAPAAPDTVDVVTAGPGVGSAEDGGTGSSGASEVVESEEKPGRGLKPGERAALLGGGKHDHLPREEGEPYIKVTIEDKMPLDDLGATYRVFGLKADALDPETKELRSRITAKRGTFRMAVDQLGLIKLNDNLDAELEDVVVEQLLGSPLAPIIFDAPRLDVTMATESLRSLGDDVVEFRSRDVRGSGRGLVAQGGLKTFEFRRGATVMIELGEGRRASITTPNGGPLSIVDETSPDAVEADGPRVVRVAASEGVHVELFDSGAREDGELLLAPVMVDAKGVEVVIESHVGDERPFIREARFTGQVRVRQGQDEYAGESARIAFEGASPSQVILEEEPSVRYVLRGESLPNDASEVALRISGRGPVVANLQAIPRGGAAPADGSDPEPSRVRFTFTGPGRVESIGGGGFVTFEDEARARGLDDRSEAVVVLAGGVHVETPEGSMDSESILATYRTDADLRLASEGPTIILAKGKDDPRDLYRLRAGGGLTAHIVDEAWFVDSAEKVHAECTGENPYRIDAGTIHNVDVAARTLTARGDIDYVSLWGEAHAVQVLTRGENSVDLEGTDEVPAVLDLAPEGVTLMDAAVERVGVRTGSIRARTFHIRPEIVIADGRVAAEFETENGVWGFDADTLRFERMVDAAAEVDPDAPRADGAFLMNPRNEVRIEAEFVREARLDALDARVVMTASRILIEGTLLGGRPGDEPGEEPGEEPRESVAGTTEAGARSSADGDIASPGVARTPGGASALDPDRPAVVRAFGGVEALFESLVREPGADPDASLESKVEASWLIKSDSATFARSALIMGEGQLSSFNLIADGVEICRHEAAGKLVEVICKSIEIDGSFGEGKGAAPLDDDSPVPVNLKGSSMLATGGVDVLYRAGIGEPEMRGRGATFALVDGERGRLEAAQGQRVRANGVLPGENLPYLLEAKWVSFTRDELVADTPELKLADSVRVSFLGGATVTELTADSLHAVDGEMRLGGKVVGSGVDEDGFPLEVEANNVTIDLDDFERAPKAPEESVHTIGPFTPVPAPAATAAPQDDETPRRGSSATGPFSIRRGEDTLSGFNPRELGSRTRIDNATADILSMGITMDAEWLAFDMGEYLLDAGRGVLRGVSEKPWTLEFASIQSTPMDDEIMIVITAPRVTFGQESARADYVSFWVDRDKWQRRRKRGGESDAEPMDDGPKPADIVEQQPNFLAELLFDLQSESYGGYLRAVFVEGGFEIARADQRAAKGSRLYIDLARAIAWLEDAELVYPLLSGGQEVPLRVRTARLSSDEEGRLVADGATLTTCDHDEPHFVVRTREFALEPRGDGRWRFGSKGNRLEFQGGVALPLPAIGNVVLDEEFGIDGIENEAGEVTPLRDIGIARTARFGTVIGAAFRFDIGNIGSWIGDRLGMDGSRIRGKWETEAQWLQDRGPLAGIGLQLRERKPGDDPDEDFRLDAFVGGIPDAGEDRGTVRVPESERDELRVTAYLRARYPIVRGEWFDFALATQTDAGVQSEFYEPDYYRFEQRDTFVRWRKSLGADYLSAGASKRVNSFRSQTEELPSFGAYRGERNVGTFTGLPVLWGGAFDAGFYRRREGEIDSDLFSDLPGGATLALGDREAGRADLTQRLSLPIQTSFAGVKATPFARMRGTAWTEGIQDGTDPLRASVGAGVELSTTLHKVTKDGFLSTIAPRVAASTDLSYEERGVDPIPFDDRDQPFDGTVVEAGVRGLWQRPATFETLDLDVRGALRTDREDGREDATDMSVIAEYITRYGKGEGLFGLRHDARYDVEGGETDYSRSVVALRPNDDWILEVSYSQGRDIFGGELFETAGVTGRWTVDPKWELEARYVRNIRTDDRLLTELVVRRTGHDFVFDLSFQDRAGEGGTAVSMSLAPLLGWARRRLGMLDR